MIKKKPGIRLDLNNKLKALMIEFSAEKPKKTVVGRKFPLGACLSYDFAGSGLYRRFIASNFDIVTFENLLKTTECLSREKSRKSENGLPVFDFSKADRMMRWAVKNGLKVHGHCLVYHKYLPDWFFREKYEYGAPYVSSDECERRMKSCIEQMITHFETEFPGTVTSWDVVNERIAGSDPDRDTSSSDYRRAYWDGNENLFRKLIGKDYVEKAFLYAKDTVEELGADIRLYANDYNAFRPTKRDRLIEMVDEINHYSKDDVGKFRNLCDGIGMQGYLGSVDDQSRCMTTLIKTQFLEAIELFSQNDLRVLITEMTVRNYDKERINEHATYYVDLLKAIVDCVNNGSANLDGIIIWGMTDISKEEAETPEAYNPYGGLLRRNFSDKGIIGQIKDILEQE